MKSPRGFLQRGLLQSFQNGLSAAVFFRWDHLIEHVTTDDVAHLTTLSRSCPIPNRHRLCAPPCITPAPTNVTSVPPPSGPLLGLTAVSSASVWYHTSMPPRVYSTPSLLTSTVILPSAPVSGL